MSVPSSSSSPDIPSVAGPGTTPVGAPPFPHGVPRTPPGRRSRKRLYLGVVVAVAIAVLLIAVLVVAMLPGSCSGGAAAVLTYSGARPVADCAAGGFHGGGWTLLFAAGLVSATTEPVPANTTALGNTTGCTYTLVANIGDLSLPGYAGNRSSGAAPAWEFGYRNSTDSIAVVSVISGQGTVLATLSGVECSFYAQLLTPVPGNAIDSSQAVAAVQPEAAAFLAAHPSTSAEYGLIGGFSLLGHTTGPEWSITYNTCALSPSATGTGAEFNATVNAITGQVVSTNTTSDVSCGSSTAQSPVASSPTIGSPSVPSLRERASVPS